MNTFSEVIRLWPEPSKASFARDVGEDYNKVNQWDRRNSIPADYWDNVVEAAKKRRIKGITLKSLQLLARNRNQ